MQKQLETYFSQIDTMDEEVHSTKKILKSLLTRIVADKKVLQPVKQELLEYYGKLSGRPKAKLKSLQEAFAFQQSINTLIKKVSKKQVQDWWTFNKGLFDGKAIEWWTLQKKLVQTRKYARTMLELRKNRFPPAFDWLEMPRKDDREQKKRAEMYNKLPTIKQILEFIKVGSFSNGGSNENENYFSAKDKALKALLVDTGARAESLLYLNIEDVKDIGEPDFLLITIGRSKSEQGHAFSFISRPYVEKLLALHPNPKPPSPLFLNKNGTRQQYKRTCDKIKVDLEKIGLEFPKRKLLHYFRNMLVSRCSAAGWTDEQLNLYFGWHNGNMKHVYDLSKDSWRKIIQPYRNMLQKEGIQGRRCDKCGTLGYFDFCEQCGQKLKAISFISDKEAMAEKAIIQELQKYPEFQTLLERLIKEKIGR